jgi:hypothetical protein
MKFNRLVKGRQGLAMLPLLVMGEVAMSLEKPDYTVIYSDGDIEYRQYEPYLVAETEINSASGAQAAGNEGFRRLFRYITGANSGAAKIAMTAPVQQTQGEKIQMTAPVQQTEAAEGWRVAFMLPTMYTLETAPQPTDTRVYVREVPGRLMAVKRFSGRWTEKNYRRNERELTESVAAAQVSVVGSIERAAYDAPYKLPFMRRNEVMLEVAAMPAELGAANNLAAAY